jgi:hypothetical protein
MNVFDRRTLLKHFVGPAALLPFSSMLANAQGMSGPRRLVIFYTPLGTSPVDFASSMQGNKLGLGRILQPLQGHLSDVIPIEGLTIFDSGTHLAIARVLTGERFIGKGISAGPSIDQVVSKFVGQSTLFPSLQFGVSTPLSGSYSNLVSAGSGLPMPSQNSPVEMFKTVFGGARFGATLQERSATASILDGVRGDLKVLRMSAGALGRQKLELHEQSIRNLERRLATQIPVTATCAQTAPVLPSAAASDFVEIGRAQIDLIAQALACDVTRVATLQWTGEGTNTRFPWLASKGVPDAGHHDISHVESYYLPGGPMSVIQTFYCEMFASLIERLKSIPEGAGSVFDQTLVVWVNSMGRGDTHETRNIPVVMAGGKWFFKTGRMYKAPAGRSHNDLLLTVGQAMGLNISSFGESRFCSGPISEIIA